MLLRIVAVALAALVALGAAVFAVQNPGTIALDLGVAALAEVRVSVAFAATFALGWLFGLLCCVLPMLRLIGQRRALRRELRAAKTEVSSLRSLPLRDAH
jgi:uncharacterized membrane protein YciS (DUF1049 family)